MEDHLSRLEKLKSEQVSINDDFPYDRLVAHLGNDIPNYSQHDDSSEGDNSSNENKEDVETILAQSTVPWYVDFVIYLVAEVLPP